MRQQAGRLSAPSQEAFAGSLLRKPSREGFAANASRRQAASPAAGTDPCATDRQWNCALSVEPARAIVSEVGAMACVTRSK